MSKQQLINLINTMDDGEANKIMNIFTHPTKDISNTNYTLIHDVDQILKFENILQEILNESLEKDIYKNIAQILDKIKESNIETITNELHDILDEKNIFRCKKPVILINMACRDKYAEQKYADYKCKSLDTFFSRKLYSTHDCLLTIIQKLEIKTDCYKHKLIHKQTNEITYVPMEQESLSIYICVNPLDQILAFNAQYETYMKLLLKNNIDQIGDKFDTDFYSHLHKSQQYKATVELDVDTKDKLILNKLFELCPTSKSNIYFIVETRNGYHYVYKKKDFPTDLYKILINDKNIKPSENRLFHFIEKNKIGVNTEKTYVSIRGDTCTPVPGTYHGGFKCRFVDVTDIC